MLALLLVPTMALALAACQSAPTRPALDVLEDREASIRTRVSALDEAAVLASSNPDVGEALTQSLEQIVWNPAQPRDLRRRALVVLSQGDASSRARVRDNAKRLVAREPDPVMVADLCDLAAENGWIDWTPTLIRVWARPGGELRVNDPERSTRAAKDFAASRDWTFAATGLTTLQALHPQKDLSLLLWAHALDASAASATTASDDGGEDALIRRDAYALLALRDVSGEQRRAWLQEPLAYAPTTAGGKAVLAGLRAGWRDLRVLPQTGEELRWLLQLADGSNPVNATWWQQVGSVAGRVPAGEQLALRHLECLRWASQHRTEWIANSRDQLAEELRRRIGMRERESRSFGSQPRLYSEDATMQPRGADATPLSGLSWADLVCVLVLDECLRLPATAARLVQQARIDNADRTSEYGGLVLLTVASPEQYVPVLYPPRARDKRGDLEFHAPDDLLRDQDLALAHYHFHATIDNNQDAAGPSLEDMGYARAWSRGCVVLTSVGKGRLNVDYFQPAPLGISMSESIGVVLDLGVLDATGFVTKR